MRLPTVHLRRAKDGAERTVNRADYALAIGAWLAKGFKLVTESRGDGDDADMQFRLQQAEIEHERQLTREAPKDYHERKITVRRGLDTARLGPSADPDPDPEPSDIAPSTADTPPSTADTPPETADTVDPGPTPPPAPRRPVRGRKASS